MNLNIRRVAVLSGLTLLPMVAFASTGLGGGLCATVCGLFGCCG